MKHISKAQAARMAGVSRAAVQRWENRDPRPEFFVDAGGKVKIDTQHPSWADHLNFIKLKNSDNITPLKNNTTNENKKKKEDFLMPEEDEDIPSPNPMSPEMFELIERAGVAKYNDIIYSAKIKEEKALQEKIKTAQIKKELAPVELILHFFSFSENLIQRLYTRPHEISPKLSELYLSGQNKQAEQLILREIEGIVKQTTEDLLKAIDDEEYKIKQEKQK